MAAEDAIDSAPDVEERPFRHVTLKHRLTAWISRHLFDRVTYTVRGGLLKGLRRKGGLGWAPDWLVRRGVTAEDRFWRTVDLRDQTVYDIGAFHGLLTMFFASRARRVVAFEPSTPNRTRLLENLQLNGIENVQVCPYAVGSRRETLQMAYDAVRPGFARVLRNPVRDLQGAAGQTVEDIPVITLDDIIQEKALPAPDFIKVDVEGFESEVLRGSRHTLESHRPALFLEMHGATIGEKKRRVAEIVGWLWERGYRQIRHVESDAAITPENAAVAMQGHLYCRRA